MSITSETLVVLLLLMPGFLASVVLNAVVVRQTNDRTARIIEALVFSFLIYAILTPFGWSLVSVNDSNGTEIFHLAVTAERLLYAMILAVGLALLIGYLMTQDWPMRMLRRLRITVNSARINTWLDIFLDQKGDVVITFTNGCRLFGRPKYISSDIREGLLYIKDPAWIDNDGKYTDLCVRGILLTNKNQIDFIEFVQDPTESTRSRPKAPPARPKEWQCTSDRTKDGRLFLQEDERSSD